MYGMEMDVWGAGCIQFELTTLYPLFPGLDEADQIHRIHNILGAPKASVVAKLHQHAPPNANFMFPPQSGIGLSKLVPDSAETFVDLLTHSVAYDASERISSKQALKHPYFTGNISISSSTAKVAGVAPHDKSRVAKIIHEMPPSKSVPSGKAKKGEQESKAGPETKHRSMVSILLARVCCMFAAIAFRYIMTSLT
jgi:serine/threonine protein kinase